MAKSDSVFDKDLRADKKNPSVNSAEKGREGDVAASPGTVCCYVSKAMRPLIYQWPNTRLIITLYSGAVKMIKAHCLLFIVLPLHLCLELQITNVHLVMGL